MPHSGSSGGSYVAAKSFHGQNPFVSKRELQRELIVLDSLRHPNVSKLVGLAVCANREYLLMELHDGSLFELIHYPDHLESSGPISDGQITEIALGLAKALDYLHGQSIVHVDVKSANVLVDMPASRSGSIVPTLCDFGHVHTLSKTGGTRMIRRYGTPNWAAPEALRCETMTTAVDIWSFGVVLWEMQSSEVPHANFSRGQLIAAVGWAGLRPDLSCLRNERLSRVTMACLEGSALKRPTAKALKKDLRAMKSIATKQTWEMLSGFFS
eukprot:gnl/MRDRNA2_/MRDRNA2_291991_c0_seq1.p1 gnl/MRDRNA2_/MRDRNA2_291991_c0~~gnl/MRDRNA2_/MRDRNA2_291991_c0_seq1.p1  ORF type:complete len:281 (+),score=35.65 gnl/MRDRNA2_/MRDRNA2_291991_c0_seq1:39-845(+)